jgi:hypothetical protein
MGCDQHPQIWRQGRQRQGYGNRACHGDDDAAALDDVAQWHKAQNACAIANRGHGAYPGNRGFTNFESAADVAQQRLIVINVGCGQSTRDRH